MKAHPQNSKSSQQADRPKSFAQSTTSSRSRRRFESSDTNEKRATTEATPLSIRKPRVSQAAAKANDKSSGGLLDMKKVAVASSSDRLQSSRIPKALPTCKSTTSRQSRQRSTPGNSLKRNTVNADIRPRSSRVSHGSSNASTISNRKIQKSPASCYTCSYACQSVGSDEFDTHDLPTPRSVSSIFYNIQQDSSLAKVRDDCSCHDKSNMRLPSSARMDSARPTPMDPALLSLMKDVDEPIRKGVSNVIREATELVAKSIFGSSVMADAINQAPRLSFVVIPSTLEQSTQTSSEDSSLPSPSQSLSDFPTADCSPLLLPSRIPDCISTKQQPSQYIDILKGYPIIVTPDRYNSKLREKRLSCPAPTTRVFENSKGLDRRLEVSKNNSINHLPEEATEKDCRKSKVFQRVRASSISFVNSCPEVQLPRLSISRMNLTKFDSVPTSNASTEAVDFHEFVRCAPVCLCHIPSVDFLNESEILRNQKSLPSNAAECEMCFVSCCSSEEECFESDGHPLSEEAGCRQNCSRPSPTSFRCINRFMKCIKSVFLSILNYFKLHCLC